MKLTMDIRPQGLPRPRIGRNGRFYTPSTAFGKALLAELKQIKTADREGLLYPMEGDVILYLTVPPSRSDLDNIVKNVLDRVQDACIIVDDKQVKKIKAKVMPKGYPVVIRIEEVGHE